MPSCCCAERCRADGGDRRFPGYSALYTVVLNLVVAVVLTPPLRGRTARDERADETSEADYHAAVPAA